MPKYTKSVAKTRMMFSNLVSGSKRCNDEAESTTSRSKRMRERTSETDYTNIWRNSLIDLDGNYFSNFFYFILLKLLLFLIKESKQTEIGLQEFWRGS